MVSKGVSNLIALSIIATIIASIGIMLYMNVSQYYHYLKPRVETIPPIDIVCYDFSFNNSTSNISRYLCFLKNPLLNKSVSVTIVLANGSKVRLNLSGVTDLILDQKPIIAILHNKKTMSIDLRKPD